MAKVNQQQTVQLEPVQVTNDEQNLVESFNEVQQQIESLLDEEQKIQQELSLKGIATTSILEKYVPVLNQESVQQPQVMTDDMVKLYVQEQRTPLAKMLYEGVVVREESRQKSVEVIVQNSKGEFTEEELKAKPTAELNKLARILRTSLPLQQQPQTSYMGAGFVDGIMSVQNCSEPGSGQGLLLLPKLKPQQKTEF